MASVDTALHGDVAAALLCRTIQDGGGHALESVYLQERRCSGTLGESSNPSGFGATETPLEQSY